MFNILICDDEPTTCLYIEKVFSEYAQNSNTGIATEIFFTGESLLEYLEQKNDIDLLFLDIELPGKSGAEIGKLMRENLENESVQIVFISSKEKYAMQLFQVRPFDFLIKPLSKKMIINTFEKYKKLYTKQNRFFEYRIGKQNEKILASEIMYFMCEKRKICIVTCRDKIYFYGNMKDLHKNLNLNGFWSVNNSFIINTGYVRLFKEKEIVMCDNYCIPVSNSYRKEIKKKLMEMKEEE